MIFGAIAYVNRGLRWIVLIDALEYESSKINSISSVSIGYFTNLFIPRAGEISRCTALSRCEKIPVEKLFGTILIERVIDIIFLSILFLLILGLKFDMIINFLFELNSHTNSNSSTSIYILFMMIVIGISFLIFKRKIKKTDFYSKILNFLDGLNEGFKSIRKIKRKKSFWIHTFSIWIMYFLMTYVCFHAIPETSQLTMTDGLFLLVLGGLGMVIPTPGGIGSYHAIVMIGLSVLGVGTVFLGENGSPSNPALIFPTIVHAAQTLVAIIMGSVGLLILIIANKKRYNEES